MAQVILSTDKVLTDSAFLALGFEMGNREAADFVPRFDVETALSYLRSNPDVAARLLSQTSGGGTVYWAGQQSAFDIDGRSAGVNIVRRRSGEEATGDNVFGEFLEKVARAFRRELSDILVDEVPVRDGQVVMDFTRRGAYASDVEERERAGERFIHVDVYRPAKFRFDSAMDGTTGHAGRRTDEEVPFHKFVCPFGTSYPSPIIVGSAAEASILYEQAIRGEVDWKALFNSLRQRNLLDSKITAKQVSALIADYTAQFDWMREQIVNNPSLKDMTIVGSSWMVPDFSMGRSIYDEQSAPSPAHVLARYINNPLLLYSTAENGVMRSLGMMDKGEPERFSGANLKGDKSVVIIIDGSDTIGGREPGRKATTQVVRRESIDPVTGKSVITADKRQVIPSKSREAVNRDYAVFAARLDAVLSGLGEGKDVILVSGSASTLGNTVGMGTPRLLERYVRERKGNVLKYDFNSGKAVSATSQDGNGENKGLSCISLEHFADCLPVLFGRDASVSFRLDENDPKSEIDFSDQSLRGDGLVCFSVNQDVNNRNVLSIGSFAVDSGLPVVHVMNNLSEETQRAQLAEGATISRLGRSDIVSTDDGRLFDQKFRNYDFSEVNNLSTIDDATGLHFPFVAEMYPSPVLVEGYSFHSALSAYIALVYSALGEAEPDRMQALIAAEGSTAELMRQLNSFLDGRDIDDLLHPTEQGRAMRSAIRMMAEKNSSFLESLLDLDGRDIVMSSSSVDIDYNRLFVSPVGDGENRFGIALAAERDLMKDLREGRRLAEKREREHLVEEASKRQRIVTGSRAEGQKIRGGLPQSKEEAKGAVWFLGTHNPSELTLDEDELSFVMWNDMNGEDPLVREKVARPYVDDGAGGHVDNNFIFLFPTDLESFSGRRAVRNMPNSKNLTGVTRVEPKSGKLIYGAFGIPVRFNNRGYEPVNPDNMPCSYRMDNDSSNFSASVVLSDSKARALAIQYDQILSLPGRERPDGSTYYTLGQVFMDEKWDVKEQKMVRNPHRSPCNLAITDTYISLLESGSHFPLNCIPLPRSSYQTQDDEVVRSKTNKGERFVSAEGRFISDLMFSLSIANATAIALGVPLRFPLDKDGHIDLGPGVPEQYRLMAEKRIDSFIGVKTQDDIVDGNLPLIERIPLYVVGDFRDTLEKAGTDLYIRPNDLAVAFGAFDFSPFFGGITVPLHEMAFRMEDGSIFKIYDAKSTKGFSPEELNKYMNYSKNDERRFIIRTTNPESTQKFISALKAYAERAKSIKVDVRLVRETEVRNQGLEGYVNLLSSNSDDFAESVHDIGREATIFNATGRVRQEVERDENGNIKKIIDVVEGERNIDGEKTSGAYYGKVDANDGFKGYAQIRYTLPDGFVSDWHTITDLELAKDTVLSLVNRTYRTDTRIVPSASVMDMFYRAEAVKLAGINFRNMEWTSKRKVELDDKIVDIARESARESAPVTKGLSKPVLVTNYRGNWKRSAVAADPMRLYVFTDNVDRDSGMDVIDRSSEYYKRYGNGKDDLHFPSVTAAVIRGLDNAMPVSTQHWYHQGAKGVSGRWQDSDAVEFRKVISKEFSDIKEKLLGGTYSEVVFPDGDGLFGGKISAITKERVPVLYDILMEEYNSFLAFCRCEDQSEKQLVSKTESIKQFKDEYRFLSNMYPCKVVFEGVEYPSSENAYQAAKCRNVSDRSRFLTISPYDAKKLGREIDVRPDWDEVKLDVMRTVVSDKFSRNPKLADALVSTGDLELVEGNSWNDRFWGVGLDDGVGENHLGRILMDTRDFLVASSLEVEKSNGVGIVFTESEGGYQKRTVENAQADDVDFTFAVAVDFSTYGEIATAKAAGDSIIQVKVSDFGDQAARKAVDEFYNALPDEFQKGEPVGVNFAGNGIYTLSKAGFSQDQVDEFMVKVVSGLQQKGVVFSSGRSGGQTGLDEAGLVACKTCGIPSVCHAPHKWLYRNADNKDVSGEKNFTERFSNKNYDRLKAVASKFKIVKKSFGRNM